MLSWICSALCSSWAPQCASLPHQRTQSGLSEQILQRQKLGHQQWCLLVASVRSWWWTDVAGPSMRSDTVWCNLSIYVWDLTSQSQPNEAPCCTILHHARHLYAIWSVVEVFVQHGRNHVHNILQVTVWAEAKLLQRTAIVGVQKQERMPAQYWHNTIQHHTATYIQQYTTIYNNIQQWYTTMIYTNI